MSVALKSQKANVERGRCRYGADHPAPEKGRTTCAQCRERREHARVARLKGLQPVRAYHCGTCGQEGHSRVTCPQKGGM